MAGAIGGLGELRAALPSALPPAHRRRACIRRWTTCAGWPKPWTRWELSCAGAWASGAWRGACQRWSCWASCSSARRRRTGAPGRAMHTSKGTGCPAGPWLRELRRSCIQLCPPFLTPGLWRQERMRPIVNSATTPDPPPFLALAAHNPPPPCVVCAATPAMRPSRRRPAMGWG